MAVFRVERTGDYTVMSNFHLKDKRLSLKAKGLLSQMLSLPDDWDYTLSGLSYINRESKDAIRSAVNELETAGYIRRRQTTDFKSLRDKGQRTGRNSCPLLLYSLSYCKSTPKISTWSKKGGPHNEHLELVITLSDYF